MRLCIYEDRAELFEPLSHTRPVFDLRCGLTTLAEKLRRALGAPEWGVMLRTSHEELYRQQNPAVPVNDAAWLSGDDLVLVNGRWLPPDTLEVPTTACMGMVGDAVAFIVMPKKQASKWTFEELPERLRQSLDTSPPLEAGGRILNYAWDLVDHNAAEICRDFAWLGPDEDDSSALPTVIGPFGQLRVAPTAKIEPFVHANTTGGPVVIDEGAVVSAFTRLEGPCYIGPNTHVHGAKIRAGTTLGPHCRVGGEIEASIIHGYSNKYHDGFLGHSYVGEWVNLGAGTQNSDLRNDYGEVTMTLGGKRIPTGMNKVGCFVGDHVKTGLGTLLNTGTNVGAFCNLLPSGGFAPKYVPSFTSWWNGALREAFTLDELLITAEAAMKRRGVVLTPAHRRLYTLLWESGAEERRRALRESEQRRLRKSA
jgi:UDP-N-acetylglucosamine diphosphorylase/glucosamine-1-phosphate N-acetyltransferase